MLTSLNDILGYSIAARDGEFGSVSDFYFDDHYWSVRYLVVDTGNWLPGRKVLLSPSTIGTLSHDDKRLSVDLDKQQIEDSPGVDSDAPVERQQEIELHDYYQWPYYWSAYTTGSAGLTPMPPPPVEGTIDEVGWETRPVIVH